MSVTLDPSHHEYLTVSNNTNADYFFIFIFSRPQLKHQQEHQQELQLSSKQLHAQRTASDTRLLQERRRFAKMKHQLEQEQARMVAKLARGTKIKTSL